MTKYYKKNKINKQTKSQVLFLKRSNNQIMAGPGNTSFFLYNGVNVSFQFTEFKDVIYMYISAYRLTLNVDNFIIEHPVYHVRSYSFTSIP